MFARLTNRFSTAVYQIRPRAKIRLFCHSFIDASPPQLRHRQAEIVRESVEALKNKATGRALIAAPTGYGKTAMFSSIITKIASEILAVGATNAPFKAVVLSPTIELNSQNEEKFKKWNDITLSTGMYGHGHYNSTADVVFATYQTFSRDNHLEKFDWVSLLVIDEAHHSAANSYQKIIEDLVEKNPSLMILGLTATASRADGKSLLKIFPNNITSIVKYQEAIDEGVLVKLVLKTMVLKDAKADKKLKDELLELESDDDKRQIDKKRKSIDNRYAELMDFAAANEAVVTHWKEQAGDRQTVVFCSTIDHCRHVTEAFEAAGVKVGLVHSQLSKPEREVILDAYSRGEIQVIVNVAMLTEGWDDPPTSCVVLLRPSSYVNTWRQMIGRGLRTSPGKENCIVLDFGMSTTYHKDTPEVTGLEEEEEDEEENVGNTGRHENDEDTSSHPVHVLTADEIVMEEVKVDPMKLPTFQQCRGLFKPVESKYLNVKRWSEAGNRQVTTMWSFLPSPETTSAEDDIRLMTTMMKTTDAVHHVAVSVEVMALVTRLYLDTDSWVAICGTKRNMKVILEGNYLACLTAAGNWFAQEQRLARWNIQKAMEMDRPYSKPTVRQLEILKEKEHHHLIVDKGFTKYEAMLIISLLFDRDHIKQMLRDTETGIKREIKAWRAPWRDVD